MANGLWFWKSIRSEQNPAEAGRKLCFFFAGQAVLHRDVSNPSQCTAALESILFSPFETNDLR